MGKTTLLFLRKGNQILLAMKKRRFGTGKWNGVGGKVMEGETIAGSLIRETKEEIGVDVALEDLVQVGYLEFGFLDKPEWNQNTTVYIAEKWIGEPDETEEMRPEWFAIDAIPFESMWVDDPYWLPLVLQGKKIKAQFNFENEGAVLASHVVEEVETL